MSKEPKIRVTCVHILPNKTHVISGLKSTLRQVKRTEVYDIMRCDLCSSEIPFIRHDRSVAITSTAAAGARSADAERHAKDLIQPYDRYGKENRKFTDAYGWNPYSKDKRLQQQPHERPKRSRGKSDN